MAKKAKKKAAPKKAVAKKAAAPKKMNCKCPAVKKAMTKSGVLSTIAEMSCLPKKDVACVVECLCSVMKAHMEGSAGKFVMPGMFKMRVVKKPAKPARKGRNPFTGKDMMFKAKPASKAVRIRALKNLNESIN